MLPTVLKTNVNRYLPFYLYQDITYTICDQFIIIAPINQNLAALFLGRVQFGNNEQL